VLRSTVFNVRDEFDAAKPQSLQQHKIVRKMSIRATTQSGKSGASPADGLRRETPRNVGIDAAEVLAFLDEIEARGLELHSFMLHRNGAVAAEGWWWPYLPERSYIMHSLAKSFLACAVGLALDEGLFHLDDKVISFFPEYLPESVDDKLAAMTVEDLLTMRSGHGEETSGAIWRSIGTSWISEFFKIPLPYAPGTKFVYTSAASYMLSAILFKVTGETLHAYLKPRLFDPLGISGETWDVGPDGINPGGNGLSCKTADILKLGILHVQLGVWDGKRILSESWVLEATRSHGGNNYGYHWVTGPDGDYRAIGLFVQMTIVFPRHGAVIAMTAGIDQSATLLPILYRHFPVAFKDWPIKDAAADARLKDRLEGVAAPHTMVSAPSALPARISGLAYRMPANPQGIVTVRFEFTANRCTFHLSDANGEHAIEMGLGDFIETRASMPGRDLHHGYVLNDALVVAGARWRDAATLEMTWIFVQSAFWDTIVCRFEGREITLDRCVNVNSKALNHPTLKGTAAGG
jgi:CubicO group peptidase (beta-lactamase class C family)